MPHSHVVAIGHALAFLSYDELPADERPPKRYWLDNKRMREHFDWVKRKREDEMKGDRSSLPPIEDPVQNPLTAGLRP